MTCGEQSTSPSKTSVFLLEYSSFLEVLFMCLLKVSCFVLYVAVYKIKLCSHDVSDGSDCGAVPGCITCSICPLLFSKSESYSINISSQKVIVV